MGEEVNGARGAEEKKNFDFYVQNDTDEWGMLRFLGGERPFGLPVLHRVKEGPQVLWFAETVFEMGRKAGVAESAQEIAVLRARVEKLEKQRDGHTLGLLNAAKDVLVAKANGGGSAKTIDYAAAIAKLEAIHKTIEEERREARLMGSIGDADSPEAGGGGVGASSAPPGQGGT